MELLESSELFTERSSQTPQLSIINPTPFWTWRSSPFTHVAPYTKLNANCRFTDKGAIGGTGQSVAESVEQAGKDTKKQA